MTDQGKRFEISILRPLQVIICISAVIFLFKGMWWLLAGCVASIFYLGIIGSKMHPLQSASNLAQGPLKCPEAQIESDILPPEDKQILVRHACTRVGIMLGIICGVVSWAILGWRWYLALAVVLFIMLLSGALLKTIFKTIR